MIAGQTALPTTSPLCSRRPAILGEISMRRSVDPAHLPGTNGSLASCVNPGGGPIKSPLTSRTTVLQVAVLRADPLSRSRPPRH
jgi:hypothetical protein